MEKLVSWIIKKSPAWFVSWSFRKIFGKKNLIIFEKILEIAKWRKVLNLPSDKWIFIDDNSFVIEESASSEVFNEDWVKYFPDKHATWKDVYLKINKELITNPLKFVSVDGGRYFVPLPKIDEAYGKTYFYWEKDSLDYKVFKIIGCLNGADLSAKNFDDYFLNFSKRCGVIFK